MPTHLSNDLHIFISYAHVDEELVDKYIVKVLRVAGFNPWFDLNLVGGSPWQEQLLEQIRQTDAFIYALTPSSVASEWCQWEYAEAVRLRKRVIPVLLKNTVLPISLQKIQYVNFTGGSLAEAGARLIKSLSDEPIFISPETVVAPESPQGVPAQAPEMDEIEQRPSAAPVLKPEINSHPQTQLTPAHEQADTYFDMGYAAGQAHDYEAAIYYYDKVTEIDPNYARAYSNRGIIRFNMGRYGIAMNDLTKAIELAPKLATPHGALGEIYWMLERYEDSLRAYQQYIALLGTSIPPQVQKRIEHLSYIVSRDSFKS